MRGRHGNFWALRAARLTRLAHRRQPHVKWIAFTVLVAAWLGFGVLGWLAAQAPPGDAIYKTLGALTVQGSYEDAAAKGNLFQQVARYAGVFVPLIGILFAFSGGLGRALASLYMSGARGHVVIVGAGPAALALARSCVKSGDAAAVIAAGLAPDTAWSLRQDGVVLYEGDGADRAVLQAARAGYAKHFVALTEDDAANLKIEATLRSCAGPSRRDKPLAAHVAIASPLLLQEVREMRTLLAAARDKAAAGAKRAPAPEAIDTRPFSLNEIAARYLIVREGGGLLALAESKNQPRPHLVVFGFEPAAEAVAVRALMSLWSMHFSAPRITVITPDPDAAAAQFAARYPQASAHDVWQADIAFMAFDWREQALSAAFLQAVETERGAPSGVVVDTGSETDSIQLALALMRTANIEQTWTAPIFLKQANTSEFTHMFSAQPPEPGRAYMRAFGMVETTATRALLIDSELDRGAAMAHMMYVDNLSSLDGVDKRKLEAMRGSWGDIRETYRAANRAVADAALIKLWDFGWRPATAKEAGVLKPPLDESHLLRMAEIEHKRWNAERLLSGWRPGETRDNAMMVHNNLVAWRDLSDDLRQRDVAQVRAAMTLAQILYPRGFSPDPRRLPDEAL